MLSGEAYGSVHRAFSFYRVINAPRFIVITTFYQKNFPSFFYHSHLVSTVFLLRARPAVADGRIPICCDWQFTNVISRMRTKILGLESLSSQHDVQRYNAVYSIGRQSKTTSRLAESTPDYEVRILQNFPFSLLYL